MKFFIFLALFALSFSAHAYNLNATATCSDGTSATTKYQNGNVQVIYKGDILERSVNVPLSPTMVDFMFLRFSEITLAQEPYVITEDETHDGMTYSTLLRFSDYQKSLILRFESLAKYTDSGYFKFKYSNVRGSVELKFITRETPDNVLHDIVINETYFDKNQNKSIEIHKDCIVTSR